VLKKKKKKKEEEKTAPCQAVEFSQHEAKQHM